MRACTRRYTDVSATTRRATRSSRPCRICCSSTAATSTPRRALRDLGITVPVFGMVKDDRHRTRALIDSAGHETGIKTNQAVFALVGSIQEETHRFAIEYQRSLRNESYASKLDAIPGVGEKRRADLLKYFKSVKAIREASVEQLALVVPRNTAAEIYAYFRSEESEEKEQ